MSFLTLYDISSGSFKNYRGMFKMTRMTKRTYFLHPLPRHPFLLHIALTHTRSRQGKLFILLRFHDDDGGPENRHLLYDRFSVFPYFAVNLCYSILVYVLVLLTERSSEREISPFFVPAKNLI